MALWSLLLSLVLARRLVVGYEHAGPNALFHVTGNEGFIESPHWPDTYPQFSRMRWLIKTNDLKPMRMEFHQVFHLERRGPVACVDHVTIYEADDFDMNKKRCEPQTSEPVGRFCGSRAPVLDRDLPGSVVVEFCSMPGQVPMEAIGFAIFWYALNETANKLSPTSDCGIGLVKPTVVVDEYDEISEFGQSNGVVEPLANSWPWAVAVFDEKSFRCMGTLISDDLILTAASCVEWPLVMYAKLGAHDAGTAFIENERTQLVCEVVDVVKHPVYEAIVGQYAELAKGYNLAVLRIACSNDPKAYTSIAPLCLPNAGDQPASSDAPFVLLGWNNTTDDGQVVLQQVSVKNNGPGCRNPFVDSPYQNADCIDIYEGGNFYPALTLGGPLIGRSEGRWRLWGVFTGEAFPGESTPTNVLRTEAFLDWITDVKQKGDN